MLVHVCMTHLYHVLVYRYHGIAAGLFVSTTVDACLCRIYCSKKSFGNITIPCMHGLSVHAGLVLQASRCFSEEAENCDDIRVWVVVRFICYIQIQSVVCFIAVTVYIVFSVIDLYSGSLQSFAWQTFWILSLTVKLKLCGRSEKKLRWNFERECWCTVCLMRPDVHLNVFSLVGADWVSVG